MKAKTDVREEDEKSGRKENLGKGEQMGMGKEAGCGQVEEKINVGRDGGDGGLVGRVSESRVFLQRAKFPGTCPSKFLLLRPQPATLDSLQLVLKGLPEIVWSERDNIERFWGSVSVRECPMVT
ncbi:hypothetical protein K1719_028610 [Acacia pycnantha]|nr:hypothetical protein K1719_028610 [Acacia pycnantha]